MSSILLSVLARGFAASSLLALAVGCSGCAHSYRVKVDALTSAEVAPGAAYRLVPRDDVKADFDPHFAQNLQIVEQALSVRGMYPAGNPRDADVVIELDYGVGSRRRSVRETMDPTHSVRTFTARPPASGLASAKVNLPAETPAEPASARPITAVTVVTLYEKYLTISARETERATLGRRKPVEVWRVTVAVEDPATTVDACLPVLVATAIARIGTSTDERETIRVSERVAPVLLATNEL